MFISVIVPVFNEEGNIKLLYSDLRAVLDEMRTKYEIVFIDDGSRDSSLKILKELIHSDSSVRVLSFDKNYGRTAALDAGFKNSKGEIVLTIDADLQYDPHDLIGIINELRDEDVDIVLGRRLKRGVGLLKRISSKIAIFTRNIILQENFQSCYLAGYKKKCLESLHLYRGFQDFIPVLLKMGGYKYREINVEEQPRKYGKSKYNIRNRLFKGLIALCVVKWMKINKLNYRINKIGDET